MIFFCCFLYLNYWRSNSTHDPNYRVLENLTYLLDENKPPRHSLLSFLALPQKRNKKALGLLAFFDPFRKAVAGPT